MDSFHEENSGLDIFLESNCESLIPYLKQLHSCSDLKKQYSEKVDILVMVWEKIIEFIKTQPSFKVNEEVFEFAYPQTINIILDSAWLNINKELKNRFRNIFENCLTCFMKFNSISVININSLIKLLDNPWNDFTLKRIINQFNDVSQEELNKYFKTENLLLLSTRIKVLIKSKSEDLALQLLNAVVKCTGISPTSWIIVYIRVMSNSINNIEFWRVRGDWDRVRQAEIRLSKLFLLLADIMKKHLGLSREVVLTAFSLNPTKECFTIVREFHNHTNMINPSISKFDLQALPPETGKELVRSPLYDPSHASIHILDACDEIGLNADVTRDLVAIITSQRYKRLSWMFGWKRLKRRCLTYIRHGVEMRNENKELNFLKIDYSLLQ